MTKQTNIDVGIAQSIASPLAAETTYVMASVAKFGPKQTPTTFAAHSGDLDNHSAGGFGYTRDISKAVTFTDSKSVKSDKGSLDDWAHLGGDPWDSTHMLPVLLSEILNHKHKEAA
ncbi:MAG: hypothetical protein COB36_11480 [Alphaproteobacteria bacterium]|nr:MAG: hypothetical protein COB36_11480 [Alphaproteobacteria bacterium]